MTKIDRHLRTNPNQELWEKGDFTQIAAFMRESGEALVRSLDVVTPPLRALDLGCGDGTTALPLALLGAEVVGVDIARNLVEAGRARAAAAGFSRLTFQQGDACDLRDFRENTFDLTLSIFGAMFAPKPLDVAAEIVRVTRPGGSIVMGNWIPNDPTSFVSQLLKISAAFSPPPPDATVSPMAWGVEENVIERFGRAGVRKERIAMVKDTFVFRSRTTSPAELIESFRRFYGPTMNAYAAARNSGMENVLHEQLVALAQQENRAADGGVAIPATFLRVTVSL